MTRTVKKEYLSAEARIRLPTPDEAIDIAHAFHAASDPDLEGTPTQQLAQQIARSFLALKPRRNDFAEQAYLNDAVKPIVHSYARGLGRRKREYRDAVKNAVRIYEEKDAMLNGGQFSKQWISVIWKVVQPLLLPAVFAIFGYLLAKLIGSTDLVSERVATTTGPSLPSIGLSVFFGWLGRVISLQLYNRSRDLISKEFKKRTEEAQNAYDVGKANELRLAREKLCAAWVQYTGRKHKETGSYLFVLESDIALRRNLEEQMRRYDQNLMAQMAGFPKKMLAAAAARLQRKKAPAPL